MPKILNNLLCTSAIFVISFLWTYFVLKSATWAVAAAAVIALCACYIIWRAQSKAELTQKVKRQNSKKVESFGEYLKYNEDNAQLFAELFRFYNYQILDKNYDDFTATKNNEKYFVALCYETENLSAERLRNAIVSAKRAKADKLYLFACKADPRQIKTANSRIKCAFSDLANAYALFDQCGKLPDAPQIKNSKTSFAAKYAFCKKRFGWYFASSLFTALLSIAAYFPYYLLGWATVMMFLALYSLLNTRYNPKKTAISIDGNF